MIKSRKTEASEDNLQEVVQKGRSLMQAMQEKKQQMALMMQGKIQGGSFATATAPAMIAADVKELPEDRSNSKRFSILSTLPNLALAQQQIPTSKLTSTQQHISTSKQTSTLKSSNSTSKTSNSTSKTSIFTSNSTSKPTSTLKSSNSTSKSKSSTSKPNMTLSSSLNTYNAEIKTKALTKSALSSKAHRNVITDSTTSSDDDSDINAKLKAILEEPTKNAKSCISISSTSSTSSQSESNASSDLDQEIIVGQKAKFSLGSTGSIKGLPSAVKDNNKSVPNKTGTSASEQKKNSNSFQHVTTSSTSSSLAEKNETASSSLLETNSPLSSYWKHQTERENEKERYRQEKEREKREKERLERQRRESERLFKEKAEREKRAQLLRERQLKHQERLRMERHMEEEMVEAELLPAPPDRSSKKESATSKTNSNFSASMSQTSSHHSSRKKSTKDMLESSEEESAELSVPLRGYSKNLRAPAFTHPVLRPTDAPNLEISDDHHQVSASPIQGLPSDWQPVIHKNGHTFFFHQQSGAITWSIPYQLPSDETPHKHTPPFPILSHSLFESLKKHENNPIIFGNPDNRVKKGDKQQRKKSEPKSLSTRGKSAVTFLSQYCSAQLKQPPIFQYQAFDDPHEPCLTTVFIADQIYGIGKGNTKRGSKENAAQSALESLCPGVWVSENVQSQAQTDWTDLPLDDETIAVGSCVSNGLTPWRILNRFCSKGEIISDCQTSFDSTSSLHTSTLKLQASGAAKEANNNMAPFVVQSSHQDAAVSRQKCAQQMLARVHPEFSKWGQLVSWYSQKEKVVEKELMSNPAHVQLAVKEFDLLGTVKSEMKKSFPKLSQSVKESNEQFHRWIDLDNQVSHTRLRGVIPIFRQASVRAPASAEDCDSDSGDEPVFSLF